ncbi:hypothetical protein [Qipengyuania sp. YIM B01966]|uniref:hypothetical protein n=1 Tax=Qipengyuania sp. YIM B01966 TaxID=2778646 RepID=UPI0018F66C94|nr:hypothetical protein [Qipengyuania sp. YIM B01966]
MRLASSNRRVTAPLADWRCRALAARAGAAGASEYDTTAIALAMTVTRGYWRG